MRSLLDAIFKRIARREAPLLGDELVPHAPHEISNRMRQVYHRIRALEDCNPSESPKIFATDEEPEAHRKRLIHEMIAEYPDAVAAYKIIVDEINSIEDLNEREHSVLHEVRYLLTFIMVPNGPGRLIDVSDVISSAIARLKSWKIEPAIVPGFNLESDRLPFEDGSIDGMLLCEVIEHFNSDPMFCLIEVNRVLRPDGFIVLSTPNAASWFAIYRALQHLQPNRFANYGTREYNKFNCIHAREYVPSEIVLLLEAAGFGDFEITTKDYGISPPYHPIPGFDATQRGETIFCRAYKRGQPRKRYLTPIYLENKDFDGFAGR
jgi:SAM-dependent methyltransferase